LAAKGARIQQKPTDGVILDWLGAKSDSQRWPPIVAAKVALSDVTKEPSSADTFAQYLGHFVGFSGTANIEDAMNLDSLLISRDADLLGVLRPALEKISVNIEVCEGFRAGSDLLAKRKYDAVIVDCDDLQNGFDLLGALRQTQSNAKSVAFAVVNGKTTTQEAFHSGANFVLQKPLTPLHAARCFNAALNFMVRERRRYYRHPVEIPLRITLPHNQELTATTTNVSEGGMAIRVLGKLTKDVQAQFRFTLPMINISLDLKGQVAWADGTGHAGIRFVEVPQSSQYQLEKWLTDHLQNEIPDQLQGYAALP
jgi:DNA-binding response OmpR family regulator